MHFLKNLAIPLFPSIFSLILPTNLLIPRFPESPPFFFFDKYQIQHQHFPKNKLSFPSASWITWKFIASQTKFTTFLPSHTNSSTFWLFFLLMLPQSLKSPWLVYENHHSQLFSLCQCHQLPGSCLRRQSNRRGIVSSQYCKPLIYNSSKK